MMLCCAVVHSIVWCGVLQTLEQANVFDSKFSQSSLYSWRVFVSIHLGRWTHTQEKPMWSSNFIARHERRALDDGVALLD